MTELEQFSKFVKAVLGQPEGLLRPCENSSQARALRRRFYRLRAELPDQEREAAMHLTVKVTGRLVHIVPTPQASVDWLNLETTDDRDSSPPVPESDRLDDSSGVR